MYWRKFRYWREFSGKGGWRGRGLVDGDVAGCLVGLSPGEAQLASSGEVSATAARTLRLDMDELLASAVVIGDSVGGRQPKGLY